MSVCVHERMSVQACMYVSMHVCKVMSMFTYSYVTATFFIL